MVDHSRWIPLDLDSDEEPPADLVPRVLTPGWLTLFSGPPGSGKSNAYQALVAAALNGTDWLGMPVRGIEHVIVVDEENPPFVVRQRLHAFGVKDCAGRLRYYSQIGCRLGEGEWVEELLEIAAEFGPHLVVIDSASSATTTATNENDSIAQTFAAVLRPLARLGAAVLILHHDRKASGPVADRVLGGVQWLGQVDRQIAFEAKATRADEWTTPNGTLRANFPTRLVAGKSRQGVGIPNTAVLIESEQDQDGAYRWMQLSVTEGEPDKGAAFAQRVVDALGAGQMRNIDLAERLGVKPNDSRLRSALATLTQRGEIVKLAPGLYELAP